MNTAYYEMLLLLQQQISQRVRLQKEKAIGDSRK